MSRRRRASSSSDGSVSSSADEAVGPRMTRSSADGPLGGQQLPADGPALAMLSREMRSLVGVCMTSPKRETETTRTRRTSGTANSERRPAHALPPPAARAKKVQPTTTTSDGRRRRRGRPTPRNKDTGAPSSESGSDASDEEADGGSGSEDGSSSSSGSGSEHSQGLTEYQRWLKGTRDSPPRLRRASAATAPTKQEHAAPPDRRSPDEAESQSDESDQPPPKYFKGQSAASQSRGTRGRFTKERAKPAATTKSVPPLPPPPAAGTDASATKRARPEEPATASKSSDEEKSRGESDSESSSSASEPQVRITRGRARDPSTAAPAAAAAAAVQPESAPKRRRGGRERRPQSKPEESEATSDESAAGSEGEEREDDGSEDDHEQQKHSPSKPSKVRFHPSAGDADGDETMMAATDTPADAAVAAAASSSLVEDGGSKKRAGSSRPPPRKRRRKASLNLRRPQSARSKYSTSGSHPSDDLSDDGAAVGGAAPSSSSSSSKVGASDVPQFRCVNRIKEGHGQPLYFVAFNTVDARHADVFASAGGNRVTIYRALANGTVDPLQHYLDADASEFYALAWSIDLRSGSALLLMAGQSGVIKVVDLHTRRVVRRLVGHGASVNELKIHPHDLAILLSVSKDMSVRLWNLQTGDCLAIFAGEEGHRDEVLSGDFHPSGSQIVSSGMDHCVMVWSITDRIKATIQHSYVPLDQRPADVPFPTVFVQYPTFSTSLVHTNYVDHCKYFGDLILSKSTDEKIVLWRVRQERGGKKLVHRLLEFPFTDCDIWYIRFALDQPHMQYLCVGNKTGTLFLWNMDSLPVAHPRRLSTPHSQRAIRCVAFSADTRILISACEDGTLFRWDQVANTKTNNAPTGQPAAAAATAAVSKLTRPTTTTRIAAEDSTPSGLHPPTKAQPWQITEETNTTNV